MASTLRLEDRDASTTLDLLGGGPGGPGGNEFFRVLGGWTSFRELDGKVTEVIRILSNVDTVGPADVMGAILEAEDLLHAADDWRDNLIEWDSIWIRYAVEDETAKRALVYEWHIQLLDGIATDRELVGGTGLYDLTITRGPWEYVTPTTDSSTTDLSTLGGTWHTTIGGGGQIPARLERFRLQKLSTGTLQRIWIGIRPEYFGTGSFVALHECEDGDNHTDTSSAVVAGTSGGSVKETTFGTETMKPRFSLRYINNAGGTFTHFHGNYLVLCRARVTNADTDIGIKMSTGWISIASPNPATTHPLTSISGDTDFKLIPLGTIQVPPIGYRGPLKDMDDTSGNDLLDQYRITVSASRYTGTGDAQFDCFILIPAEYQVYMDDAGLLVATHLTVMTAEDGAVTAVVQSAAQANFVNFPTVSDTGMFPWGFPVTQGLVVVAGERDAGNIVTEEFDAVFIDALYPRVINYHD